MMRTIYDFFSTEWAYALGWTLLHSVWQSLGMFVLLRLCLHSISPMFSKLRYAIACLCLTLTLLFSVITFTYYTDHFRSVNSHVQNATSGAILTLNTEQSESTVQEIFVWGDRLIDANIPFLITMWMIGFLIFSVRLFMGLIYTHQLRSSAITLQNRWTLYVHQVSEKMGITSAIEFAETHLITAPMVIGYLKPVILFPVGMLTGLSAEQIETIFIHELAHIKRNDFLVNIIQSVVESVFFFNPFVWSMSADIRRERELCCDDLVMQIHGGGLAYARALAQLEEARLSKKVFAVSLAENKHELLNRIKRIMEKSKPNSYGKGRIIFPIVLIAAGLLCASWLGVEEKKNSDNKPWQEADTTVRKNNNSSSYSRKRVITIGENKKRHEEIVEEYGVDLNLRPLPDLEIARDVFPEIAPIAVTPVIPPFDLEALPDSIPIPGFGFRDAEEWEEFSKAIEDEFRAKFQDFFASHEQELKAIMEDFEQKFKVEPVEPFHIPFQDFESLTDELERIGNFREEFLEELGQVNDQDLLKDLQENLDKLQENIDQHPLEDLHQYSDLWNFDIREKELKRMLIKDGYLSHNESIETLEWNDTLLKVNGVKIKDGDRKRYEALLNKRRSVNNVE